MTNSEVSRFKTMLMLRRAVVCVCELVSVNCP
jgi:hypothetical protein